MTRTLFPAVVGLAAGSVSFFCAAVGGGRDGGGVVGDGDGDGDVLITLTWCRRTRTVPLGSLDGRLPSYTTS
jgi:hypothetical protein